MHTKARKVFWVIFWIVLLCLEAGFVINFYVVPEFQARNAPLGRWGGEAPHSLLLLLAGIVFLVALVTANVALVVTIWRRFKNLRTND
jgi:uncharacterized membrane protein YhaH (DUF805 family)